jgi:hypothetical protein
MVEPIEMVVPFQDVRYLLKVLLGRDPQNAHEAAYYANFAFEDAFKALLLGEEFAQEIELSLNLTGYVSTGRFKYQPTKRLRQWLKTRFAVEAKSAQLIDGCDNWRNLLSVLWNDGSFSETLTVCGFDEARRKSISSALKLRDDTNLHLTTLVHPQKIEGECTFVDCGEIKQNLPPSSTKEVLKTLKRLKRVKATASGYIASDNDPQMFARLQILPGKYLFMLKGRFSYENGSPIGSDKAQCYLDFGTGYSEAHSFIFPIRNGRLSVNGFMVLDSEVKGLRFDPADVACEFEIDEFKIAGVEGLEKAGAE